MNPFWKIYFLAVIGQSFLVIDGYLLNPGMRHTGTFRSCARAQATRGHPGQGDFSHLAYHTHAPVGMLQVIGTPSFSPLAQVTSGNLAYHQAHRMTVAGVTVVTHGEKVRRWRVIGESAPLPYERSSWGECVP